MGMSYKGFWNKSLDDAHMVAAQLQKARVKPKQYSSVYMQYDMIRSSFNIDELEIGDLGIIHFQLKLDLESIG